MNYTSIVVCTYRRPELLERVTRHILCQMTCLSADLKAAYKLRLMIIDNDPGRSAETVVRAICSEHESFDIAYIAEPRTGVGWARNAAFEKSRGDSALVFFDDDQIPDEGWLATLLERHGQYPGDVLIGPVTPLLPLDAPLWARGVSGWGARVHADNTLRSHAGFGNILLPGSALMSPGCEVPLSFLKGPGEDTVVTRMLSKEGFVLRTVRDASAKEPVHALRITRSWLKARARASAYAWAKVMLHSGEPQWKIAAYASYAVYKAFVAYLRVLSHGGEVKRVEFERSVAVVQGYGDYYRRTGQVGEA